MDFGESFWRSNLLGDQLKSSEIDRFLATPLIASTIKTCKTAHHAPESKSKPGIALRFQGSEVTHYYMLGSVNGSGSANSGVRGTKMAKH